MTSPLASAKVERKSGKFVVNALSTQGTCLNFMEIIARSIMFSLSYLVSQSTDYICSQMSLQAHPYGTFSSGMDIRLSDTYSRSARFPDFLSY